MPNYHKDSYKSIKVSAHAKTRTEQRLGTASSQELQKMAFAARNKGVKIWLLNKENKKESGLDDVTYTLLKRNLQTHPSGGEHTQYFYKNNIFIFHGKYLITVIPLNILGSNKNSKMNIRR